MRSVNQRRAELRRLKRERLGDAPNGEELSLPLLNIQLIELRMIKDDPTFVNTRVHEDALRPELNSNEGQKLADLEASMREDGLKVPIEVVEGPRPECYFIRAGFRRRKIAVKLRWQKIPAIVWPADTPQKDEYWINILENATRKQLTSYETAHAAKLMRDKFGITAAEFSRKAGFSEGYISKMLACADRLPELLLEQWKMGAGLSFDEWYHLALMDPEHAVKRFWAITGQRPRDLVNGMVERTSKKQPLPPVWMTTRMMKLYEGIEGSELEPRVRDLVLRAIEICMGTRDIIRGVYEPRKQSEYAKRARLRNELKMPEPGEEKIEEPKEMKEIRPLDASKDDSDDDDDGGGDKDDD